MNDLKKRIASPYRRLITILATFFIKGLLFIMPLFISGYTIYWIVSKVDQFLSFGFPGLGLLTALVFITLVGFLVTHLITTPIASYFEKFLNKLPLFKLIYTSIRDFMKAFFGDEKKFSVPVLVQMNELGVKKVGFITQKTMDAFGLQEEVGVYFPHSYNFSGEFFIVHQKYVKPLNFTSSEIMKFVVSGGVSDLSKKRVK